MVVCAPDASVTEGGEATVFQTFPVTDELKVSEVLPVLVRVRL
jgi:hypothetical protein